MTPRPRKRVNKSLPENLYPTKVNGKVYYRYRHPLTGKFHGVGKDKAQAIKDAKQLNSILMPESDKVSKIIGSETLSTHIKWFEKEIIPKKKYATKTVEMYQTKFRQLKEGLGEDTSLDSISIKDLSDVMDTLSIRSAQQLRQVTIDLFKTAVGKGLVEENIAERTLKPISEDKKRQRMTFDQFKQALEASPNWLKNAMNLALITLQRRSDIVMMRFDAIENDAIKVVQKKTQKYDTGYLRIAIGDELSEIISQCRDDIVSPYLVHRDPERRVRRTDMHWTQIKPEYVTRTFKEVTDKLELFESIPADERPTFHEIRALGIKRYRDLGINPQKLAGHASEFQTNNYDSDHEDIRWVEVETL